MKQWSFSKFHTLKQETDNILQDGGTFTEKINKIDKKKIYGFFSKRGPHLSSSQSGYS
jgi:hypothetical protein